MKTQNKITLTFLAAVCSLTSTAQVGIGTLSPNENAALELSSVSQGLLLPRMTTLQRDAIASPVKGLTIFNTTLNCIQTNIGTSVVTNWKCFSGISPSSNGTAIVSGYTCSTASQGTMIEGVAASNVTQTITANVTALGTYSISTSANGITFTGSGTFAGTGAQNIVLSASGTPTIAGSNTFTLNTSPNCNFSRTTVNCGANVNGTFKRFMCYNLGVTGSQDALSYQSGTNNGTLYQWGRQTDGHELRTSATQAGPVGAPVPNKFITVALSPFDWITPQNNTLWGNGTTLENPSKAANDPCPTGFKVPSQIQWGGLFKGGTLSGAPNTATENTWTWTGNGYLLGTSLYLPAAGYRQETDGTVRNVQLRGYYWTSTVVNGFAYYLRFESSNVNPADPGQRGDGFSVRCISE